MSDPNDRVEGFVCTLDTCSVKDWGYIHYQPTIPGNVLYLALMAILGLTHAFLGWRYRTKAFAVCMVLGLFTETLGYVSRVLLHGDPFNRSYFLWYLITLTIGPVFIAAAIYLTIGRIVVVYGEGISRLRPRTYTTFFLGCDIASLVVQAVGGGIAASFPVTNKKMIDLGTNILVAGLSIQVASLFFFLVASFEYLFRASRRPDQRNPQFADLASDKQFKTFLIVLFAAAILLFTRTCFRAVELSEGFGGELANDEVAFMVLDGAMIILSSTCLAVMHPGVGFKRRWNEAVFFFRSSKVKKQGETGEGVAPTGSGSDKVEPETPASRL